MKLVNHIYKNQKDLLEFLEKNHFIDEENILIQIFSSDKDTETFNLLKSFLKEKLKSPKIIATTTAGIVNFGDIVDNSIVLSFSIFKNSSIKTVGFKYKNNHSIMFDLKKQFINEKTKLIIIFANTFKFDISDLLEELSLTFPKIVIAGGNSGDNYKFQSSEVYTQSHSDCDLVMAFIDSDILKVETKYLQNWQKIGKNMKITKSSGCEVFEIDYKPAIEVYEHYLGKEISQNILEYGIEFPIIFKSNDIDVARAAVGVNEKEGSISFAGNIPQNCDINFGYANIEHIENLNKQILQKEFKNKQDAIFVYSCGSRRLMLGNFLNDELQNINQIAPTCGFITYGEFFHDMKTSQNNLLNITTTYVVLNEDTENKETILFENKDIKRDRKDITLKALTTLLDRTSFELDKVINNLEEEVEIQVKQLREKDSLIAQQSKMVEVGNMIGAITHQWQQPLNSITLLTSLNKIRLNKLNPNEFGEIEEYMNQKESLLSKYQEDIDTQITFMSQTINDFKNFLKPVKNKLEFSMKNQIEQTKRILEPILRKEEISINLVIEEDTNDLIFGYPSEFSQVILNLINNAKDAIVYNNKLVEEQLRKIDINIFEKENKIYLTIQDYAGGIPQKVIDKIFDNYYTTKGDNGTGIGLSISKNILENMNASINVKNNKGGALFTIIFNSK